jgi:hypothetical protein
MVSGPGGWYVMVPCAIAAIVAHPNTSHMYFNRVLWALCVYVEAGGALRTSTQQTFNLFLLLRASV